jgi:hypothetical protein
MYLLLLAFFSPFGFIINMKLLKICVIVLLNIKKRMTYLPSFLIPERNQDFSPTRLEFVCETDL